MSTQYEFPEPLQHQIRLEGAEGFWDTDFGKLVSFAKEHNEHLTRQLRMAFQNQLAAVNGEPLPFPELNQSMLEAQAAHAAKREAWERLDLLERLATWEVENYCHECDQAEDVRLEAAREIERLRAQVAELLPWAKAAAGNLLPFGTGLTADDGERLLARIEAGEFGEAAS